MSYYLKAQCLLKAQFLLLLFVAFFVASCSPKYGPSGRQFSSEKTYLIVKGMSGEEVLQIMEHAPHERLVLDGRETWIWVFSDNGQTKSFSVSLYNKKVEDTFTYKE